MKRIMDLASFLANAPSLFGEEATLDEEIDPDIARGIHQGAIRHFGFGNGDVLSCVRWDAQFYITSTDIIRALVHRFQDIKRPVANIKKFEEGVFSDLRSLKPGVDARLEPPRSEFLELLHRHHCVRTQKKQKVFFWEAVPHDLLFREALERDLKREAMGIEPTTKLAEDADPTSFVEIAGIELPLSVPPTLAAHTRIVHAPGEGPAAATPTARVSSANIFPSALGIARPAVANGDQGAFLTPDRQHQDIVSPVQQTIPTVSSVLSINSMVSSNGDEMDSKQLVCSKSSSSSTESAAYRVTTTQGLNDINNNSSSLNGNTNVRQPSLSEYISGKATASAGSGSRGSSDLDRTAATAQSTSIGLPEGVTSINDSWTGVNFQQLHKQASELRTNYDEYQPTPTPHHSPKEDAVTDKGLLELLGTDPNALITPDNVGSFSALLEQLLGNGGRVQEASPSLPVSRVSVQNVSFSNSLPIFQSQSQQLQQFDLAQQTHVAMETSSPVGMESRFSLDARADSMGMDIDLLNVSARNRSNISHPAVATSVMVTDSMHSSPSVASLINSQHLSTSHTPETIDTLQFNSSNTLTTAAAAAAVAAIPVTGAGSQGGGDVFVNNQPISLNDLDELLASAGGPAASLSGGNTSNQMLSEQSAFGSNDVNLASQPISSLLPVYNNMSSISNGSNGQNNSVYSAMPFNASVGGDAQASSEEPKASDLLKQLWLNQKPSHVATPRSTRFSRFHPYLKTMARIAHRGSPTLLNRVPSTADPNIAAAVVNALAAKIGRDAADTSSTEPRPDFSGNDVNKGGAASWFAAPSSSVAMQSETTFATGSFVSSSMGVMSDSELPAHNVAGATVGLDAKISEHKADKARGEGDGEQIRRYTCTYAGCNKQFKRHEHLKRHFRTHTGERPYKCPAPDCGKVFARMDNLNQHIRTHVNRKTANKRINSGADNASSTLVLNQLQPELEFAETSSNLAGRGANAQQMVDSRIPYAKGTADVDGGVPVFGELSLFGSGLTALASNSSNGSAVLANAVSTMASMPSALAAKGANDQEGRAVSANMDTSFSDMQLTKASGTANARGMRIAMPEELSLLDRDWFINNNWPQQQQQQQQDHNQPQQPLQSPLIENNIVSMLRKISKSNRLRGIAASSPGVGNNNGNSNNNTASGIGAVDTQIIGTDEDLGISGLPRTMSTESNISSINTVWLASFLAQNQQQQQQHSETPQLNADLPSAPYLNPYNEDALMHLQHDSNSSGRVSSLKRHLDDGDDSDAIMSTNSGRGGSHQSMSVSEDEHSDGRSSARSRNSHKLVRPNIAPKSSITPV
ncbi:hypothetical protein EDC05_001714 [Coemansia umbellata]|nr:hypothetical protein EDC05_001714 [Coemansia umbellata]